MSDMLDEAKRLYTESMDALSGQRRQIEEDLAFSDPADPQQWDREIKRLREADPGGARPCLVFDQCGQYVANVAGQAEKMPPSLHAIPVGDGADRKAAEHIDGFYRHIEYTSRATQHYQRALTSAARVGVGYLIVRPEYVNRALNYQEPRISSEGDPLRVVFDPWSVELDGSDATFGFLLTPMSKREFARKYPKRDAVDFGDTGASQVADDERESVEVVEMWQVSEKTVKVLVCTGPDGNEMALREDDYARACERMGMQLPVSRVYKDKVRTVKWFKASGADILEEPVDADGKVSPFPADSIGIVPMYGYVGWSGGRMTYCGIPRRAMAPARSYNYHQSELHAYMAQAPRAPWIVPARAVRGLEHLWDRASVESRAWLPYHDVDEAGTPISAPARMPIASNLQNHIAGAEQALRDIQAAIGMYAANLGAPSNEQSGVAIDARKQQGEASTAHFPAHQAASIGQVGRLCMEMIPRLVDTRRQIRILGIDGAPGHVTMDPGAQAAYSRTDDGVIINPTIGQYDVRVVVGASFSTQRTQTQLALSEVMGKNPGLTPAIAPLWAQTLDIPNADKLAQVLTAVAPPEVQAILKPDTGTDAPNPAELQAAVTQLQQALQEAVQHAHEAQDEADKAIQECSAMKADAAAKQRELEIKAYDAETKRLQVVGANELQAEQIQAQLLRDMAATDVDGEGGAEEPGEPAEPEEQAQQPDGFAALRSQIEVLRNIRARIAQQRQPLQPPEQAQLFDAPADEMQPEMLPPQ